MSIQRFGWVIIVTVCLALLGLSNPVKADQSKSALKVGWGVDAVTLDPALQRDMRSGSVLLHIMETLVTLDLKDLSPKPLLAKRWEIVDGKTYRFHLREGITFHDGEPLNAQAVKYSLDRFIAPETSSPRALYLKMVAKIKVVDDFTLDIILKNPFGPFLQHLAYQGAAIVSPKAAQELGLDKFGFQPIGTGPFKLKEWRKGEEIVLTRNETYWGKPPALTEIRFKVITEETTRVIALETGEIDMALDVPAHDADRLKALPGISLITKPTPRTVYVALNTKVEPFDDVRVRRAIYYATDTKGLVKALFGEYAVVPAGPMVSFLFGGKEFPKDYDPQKAKDLMVKAGYPRGFEAELWTPLGRYPQDKQAATLMASQLEENIGIKANVRVFEWAAYLSKLKTRKYAGMVLLGWGNVTGDADMFLYPHFHSSQQVASKNLAHYSNPVVDKLLVKARISTDPDVRRGAYHGVLEILQEDHLWIPLYVSMQIFALRDYVKGFVPSPIELIMVDKVLLAK